MPDMTKPRNKRRVPAKPMRMLSDLVLPVGGWLAGLLLAWHEGGDPVPVLAVSAVVAVGGFLYVLVTGMRGWWNVPAIVATVLSMLVAGDLSGSGWAMMCPLAALAFAVTVWADTGLREWRGSWGPGRACRGAGRGRSGGADADDSGPVGPPAPPLASDGFGTGMDRFLLANQLDMPWDADADRQAEANGYEGVDSCVVRLRAGDRRVCHEGIIGFVDFGTVNWNEDDRIGRINGLPVCTEADIRVMGEEGPAGSVRCRGALLLDDRLFAAPDMALWKSDESLAPDPVARGESPVVGMCGLQVNPKRTWIIPWRDVRGVRVTGDGTIMCDLGGGTELAITLDGKPGWLRNILDGNATAAWHGRVRSIAAMIGMTTNRP